MEIHGDKESKLRQWVIKQIKSVGFAESIENTTKSGNPDVHACIGGKTFWIELKRGKHPWPLIRKEQRIWGIHYARAGGTSFFLYHNEKLKTINLYAGVVLHVNPYQRWLEIHDVPIKITDKKSFLTDLKTILSSKTN